MTLMQPLLTTSYLVEFCSEPVIKIDSSSCSRYPQGGVTVTAESSLGFISHVLIGL
jgi:hypothetical protein